MSSISWAHCSLACARSQLYSRRVYTKILYSIDIFIHCRATRHCVCLCSQTIQRRRRLQSPSQLPTVDVVGVVVVYTKHLNKAQHSQSPVLHREREREREYVVRCFVHVLYLSTDAAMRPPQHTHTHTNSQGSARCAHFVCRYRRYLVEPSNPPCALQCARHVCCIFVRT